MKYVIADFESTMQKIVHSVSFMPVSIEESKNWISHGRGFDPEYKKSRQVSRGTLRRIFIREALEEPSIYESERVLVKFGKTIAYGDGQVEIMSFRDAICELLHTVWEHGDGNWLAHAMDNELDILQESDRHFKTGLFPKSLRSFPDVSTIPGWSKIAKVCTQQLLTHRCPEFFSKYQAWMTMNGWSGQVKFSSRLEDFVRFVRDDRDYTQKHIAPSDVEDLFQVLIVASPPLDGKSLMISFPVSSWKETTSIRDFFKKPEPVSSLKETTSIRDFFTKPEPVSSLKETTSIRDFFTKPEPVSSWNGIQEKTTSISSPLTYQNQKNQSDSCQC